MALWFPIMENDFRVGTVVLVRTDPVFRKPEENEICTYKIEYTDSHDQHTSKITFKGTIEYPYLKDNPIPLLGAALERVRECLST